MKHFKPYTKEDILALTRLRKFETRLGERVQVLNDVHQLETSLQQSNAKFVLIGIPEDIGSRANYGIGGTNTAWKPFLHCFMNIQSNDFMDGNELLVAGYFDFADIEALIEQNAHSEEEKIDAYRHAVNIIDEEVEHCVNIICRNKKIPIVVGGGHNNAYPCIKGAAKGLYRAGLIPLAQINAINLDAHTDFRPAEGRHSGNGFRYADEDGYLERYCVIGAHENYITQNMWVDIVNDPFIDLITYEDIFIYGKRSFHQSIQDAAAFTNDTYCGIELDLDCIANTLSSAESPVGLTPLHARQYVSIVSRLNNIAYLHIAEGAVTLADGRTDKLTPKLISYLVSDFIKSLAETA